MKIIQNAMNEIMFNVNGFTNEIGGILGGYDEVITRIVLDVDMKGNTPFKYVQNVSMLNRCISSWNEQKIKFYGIFHTHFNDRRLSKNDRNYIVNIMNQNSDNIKKLYFPIIVLPEMKMYVYKAEKKRNKQIEIVTDKINICNMEEKYE